MYAFPTSHSSAIDIGEWHTRLISLCLQRQTFGPATTTSISAQAGRDERLNSCLLGMGSHSLQLSICSSQN